MDGLGNQEMDRHPQLACLTADPQVARGTYLRSWFE